MIVSMILLVTTVFSVAIMVRAMHLNQYLHTHILLPWRQAIEVQDIAAHLRYRAVAEACLADFYKLVLIPWRKPPRP